MKNVSRIAVVISSCLLQVACGGGGGGDDGVSVPAPAPAPVPAPAPTALTVDTVTGWNDASIAALKATEDAGTVIFSEAEARLLAMAFVAEHDTINGISRRYASLIDTNAAPTGADPNAAVGAAVHDVLVSLFPTQVSAIESTYQTRLAAIPDGPAKTTGIGWGQQVAATVIAARSDDGSTRSQAPYSAPLDPLVYQPTNGQQPYDVKWSEVKPFVVSSASKYRALPPYAVDDPAYYTDFVLTAGIGGVNPTTRTVDQSQIGVFWLENQPTQWNRVARSVAAAKGLDATDQARVYALNQVAMADALITVFDSKYYYRRWRPITAIRAAATDGNAQTVPQTDWMPYQNITPPHPDYTSSHAGAAGAAAEVLTALFGDHTGFTMDSERVTMTRSFASFVDAATECSQSRVYIGFHFSHAVIIGQAQGKSVADEVVASVMTPVAASAAGAPGTTTASR